MFYQPVPFPRLFELGSLHGGLWSRPRGDSFDPEEIHSGPYKVIAQTDQQHNKPKVARSSSENNPGNIPADKPATLRDATTAIIRSIVGTGVLFVFGQGNFPQQVEYMS